MTRDELMRKTKDELCDIIAVLELKNSSLIREVNRLTPQSSHIQEVEMYKGWMYNLFNITNNLSECVNTLSKEVDYNE
jgi:hypothetical protein